MTVVVITPPEPVVTFEEVAKHLGDVPAEDKAYVEALTAAATAWIDGPDGWLGRAIGVQLLEYCDDAPCSPIVRLPYPPIIEIVEAYSGEDPLPVDQYQPGAPSIGFGMALGSGSPLRIRYWAGYGTRDETDPDKWVNTAPPPIKVAIMMLVAQWYNTRENVITGTITSAMPFAVDALLHPFRVYR